MDVWLSFVSVSVLLCCNSQSDI